MLWIFRSRLWMDTNVGYLQNISKYFQNAEGISSGISRLEK